MTIQALNIIKYSTTCIQLAITIVIPPNLKYAFSILLQCLITLVMPQLPTAPVLSGNEDRRAIHIPQSVFKPMQSGLGGGFKKQQSFIAKIIQIGNPHVVIKLIDQRLIGPDPKNIDVILSAVEEDVTF